MISTVNTRNAFITEDKPNATNTNSVRITNGWSRDPKAMKLTTACTATGTTRVSKHMPIE